MKRVTTFNPRKKFATRKDRVVRGSDWQSGASLARGVDYYWWEGRRKMDITGFRICWSVT